MYLALVKSIFVLKGIRNLGKVDNLIVTPSLSNKHYTNLANYIIVTPKHFKSLEPGANVIKQYLGKLPW